MSEYEKIYGYARVSTREQNEDRQIVALKEMGVPDYREALKKNYNITKTAMFIMLFVFLLFLFFFPY